MKGIKKEESILLPSLPKSNQVDTITLSQIFNQRTNSYKYLFFLSLLDILRRNKFEARSPISFAEIVIEMLANAWFPHTYFKLSFGLQDKITKKLDALNLNICEPILRFRDSDKKLLRETIQDKMNNDIVSHVIKYVPFRLIRPFFSQDVQGLKDSQINQTILKLANSRFQEIKPLYHFTSDSITNCSGIILSQDWVKYIEANFVFVKSWASWEWLQYMQLRNPNTPNIIKKIFVPQHRGTLTSQTKFWQSVLQYQPLTCIYSGRLIDRERFSLDHYLPWSFVAHDQIWNLVPVVPEVNSSKSNHIPSHKYFLEFVRLQHLALETNHLHLSKKAWNRVTEPYNCDLRLSENDLLDPQKLCCAYESIIQPLTKLAMKQGFSTDWEYFEE